MRLLLIGPPGCGKGTQGARIAAHYGVEHIAAGDILRAEVAAGTPLGRDMAGYLKSGRLVPDQLIIDLVMPRIVAAAVTDGYVLDGFPRSLPQATIARQMLMAEDSAVRRAVLLDVPRETLMERLLARAVIEGRPDDTPDVIRARLEVFDTSTAPVVDFYRARGLLLEVDGSRHPDEVTESIRAALPPLVRARARHAQS